MSLKIDRVELEIVIKNDETRKQIRLLEDDIRSTTKALKKAKEGTEEWTSLDQKLKNLRTQHDALYDKIGLTNLSIKELNRRQQELRAILTQVPGNSPLYTKYKEQLDQVGNRIKELKGNAKDTHLSLGQMADGFNRYFGMVTAFAASLTGVALVFKSLREERDKLDDSKANLKGLTGLDQDSVNRLEQMAKDMSVNPLEGTSIRIRQSAQEIVDAYTIVGSNKSELLGSPEDLNNVTKFSLILKAGSKDIKTLDDAANALTLSLNQYGQGADQAARFTNVLAAGAKEGAANVASETEAIVKSGVAANDAKLKFEQHIGVIQTLAEKGIKDEIAGTGLKKFFITLETGAKETRPSLVGLDTALERLKAKNMDAKQFKDMFGEEGYNVAKVLVNNTDKVKQYTAAVTNTQVAMEQAAENSKTPAAVTAQNINKIKLAGIDLINKMQPAMMTASGLFMKFITVLPGMIDWFQRWGTTIATATTLIALYTAAVKIQIIWTKALKPALDFVTDGFKSLFATIRANPWGAVAVAIGIVIGLLVDYARQLNSISQTQKSLKKVQDEVGSQMAEQKGKVDALVAAIHNENLAHDKRRKAIEELRKIIPGYNAELSKEGKLINENKQAITDYLKELQKKITLNAIQDEVAELMKNNRLLNKDLRSNNQRTISMSKANANADDIVIGEDAGATSAAAGSIMVGSFLQKSINLKKQIVANNNAIKALFKEYSNNITSTLDAITPTEEDNGGSGGTGDSDKAADAAKKAADKEIEALKDAWNKKQALINEQYFKKEITEDEFRKKMYDGELSFLESEKSALQRHGQATGDISKQIAEKKVSYAKEEADRLKKLQEEIKKKAEEAAKDELRILSEKQAAEELALDQRRVKEKMTDGQYNAERLAIEKKFLEQQLQVLNLSEEQKSEIRKKILENEANTVEGRGKDRSAFDDKYGDPTAKIRAQKTAELNILKDFEARGIVSHEEAVAAKKQLDNDYMESLLQSTTKTLEQVNQISGNLTSAISGFQSAETSAVERKYKKLIKAAGNNSKQTAKLEEEKEQELAKIKAKYADKAFVVNTAQIVAATALAAINAYSSAVKTPVIGPVLAPIAAAAAIAAGAAQIAQANQAREDARSGYYDGGYTTAASSDHKPVGVVHANEFVGTARGVRNPAVRQFYDVFNSAQMDGSIGMLNTTEILKRISLRGGFYNGGYTDPSIPQSLNQSVITMSDLSHLSAVLQRNAEVMDKVHAKLGEPLQASVAITGKKGINEQKALYDRMISNTRRSG